MPQPRFTSRIINHTESMREILTQRRRGHREMAYAIKFSLTLCLCERNINHTEAQRAQRKFKLISSGLCVHYKLLIAIHNAMKSILEKTLKLTRIPTLLSKSRR